MRSPSAIGAVTDVRRRIARHILHCKGMGCIIKCTVTVIPMGMESCASFSIVSSELNRGAGMRTALAILRDAPEPLTTRQIVVMVFDRLNMPEPDCDDLKLICCSLNSALRNKAARGGVAMVEGRPVWSALG